VSAAILSENLLLHPTPHSGGPGSRPGLVKWDLWGTKWRRGRLSPSTSVSPANLHSTKLSMLTITLGRYNGPEVANVPSGHSFDSIPPPAMRMKKIKQYFLLPLGTC
jgi:hypothetical protein